MFPPLLPVQDWTAKKLCELRSRSSVLLDSGVGGVCWLGQRPRGVVASRVTAQLCQG